MECHCCSWFHHRHSLSVPQAVQLACEELRKSLDKVAAEESGDLTWKELVAAAGNPAGFAPSKVFCQRATQGRLSCRVRLGWVVDRFGFLGWDALLTPRIRISNEQGVLLRTLT